MIGKIMLKYKKMSVPVRASFWYTFCNFVQKGISFFVIPLYVRILTTAEYGEYSVFQSWRDILIIFASMNLYCGVYTKAMVDLPEERDRYTSSMQGLGCLFTSAYFILYLIFYDFWTTLFKMDYKVMVFLFLYFVFFPAFNFWSTRQRVEYKYRIMVVVTLLIAIATPLLSLLLLVLTTLRSTAVIYGYLIVQCSVGGFLFLKQFLKGRCFFDKQYWKHALSFNIPLIPHYLSLIVLGQVDRIMVDSYCGPESAGIYSFAYQIGYTINILISAINGTRVPWTYEKLKEKNYVSCTRVFNLLCGFMALLVVTITLVSPEIIAVMATPEYSQAVYVIPVVALGIFFTFCYDLFSTVEFYYSATKFVMVASIVGAVLNIVLNAIFIPQFGYIAAAYTTMICYLVLTIMHLLFTKKVCEKNEVDLGSLYDIKSLVNISIAVILTVFIIMALYDIIVMRYGIILLFAILIYKNRKKIEMIRKKK